MSTHQDFLLNQDGIFLHKASPTHVKIGEFMREVLRENLNQLPEKNIGFFHKVYPEGADGLELDRIPNALRQIEATAKKLKGKS